MKQLHFGILCCAVGIFTLACEQESDAPVLDLNEQFSVVEGGQEGKFTFIATTRREDVHYHWYIDDVLVENSTDHAFQYSFLGEAGADLPQGPGEYRVCLNIVSLDAPEGTDPFCETITVTGSSDNCPVADFNTEEPEPGLFEFSSDFSEEGLFYWYIDDVLAGDAGSNTFQYDFLLDDSGNVPYGPGDYNICLKIVTPDCQEGSDLFCETITVGADPCPPADFTTEEKEPGLFEFSSDFSGEGLFYWYIDDVLAGDAGSNTFQYDFLLDNSGNVPYGPGDYNICLKIITPDCQDGSELFCETITVAVDPCPVADFTTEETQPNVFKFTSQFSDPAAIYYWYLDEALSGDAAKDYFEYDFTHQVADPYRTGPGEYELCLEIVTPDCQEGSERVCEVVTVEEANTCPDPSFTTEETQNGVFKFSAAFDSNAIYYWYIDGTLAGDAGSNTFEYDFLINSAENLPGGPGDYDICLRMATPDCPDGTELYCDTITVD